jgi:hypothetical protein
LEAVDAVIHNFDPSYKTTPPGFFSGIVSVADRTSSAEAHSGFRDASDMFRTTERLGDHRRQERQPGARAGLLGPLNKSMEHNEGNQFLPLLDCSPFRLPP